MPSLPDLPTLAEPGFPDVTVSGCFAGIAPKGLPPAPVKRLHEAVVAALPDPEVKAAMVRQENLSHPTTPEAAGVFLTYEFKRHARLVKKIGLTLDSRRRGPCRGGLPTATDIRT